MLLKCKVHIKRIQTSFLQLIKINNKLNCLKNRSDTAGLIVKFISVDSPNYASVAQSSCFETTDKQLIIAVKPQNGALALSMSKKLFRNPCK